jgi:hypothetical protein
MGKKHNRNKNKHKYNMSSILYSPTNKEIMAWLDTTKTGIWVESEDRSQLYDLGTDLFGYKSGIREITKNLATAGWYDKVPKDWQVVDVWEYISDDECFIKPVKDKIKEVIYLLNKGQKVCVRCAAGMNRSNSIATAALVYLDKDSGSIRTKWLRYSGLVKSKVDRAWMNDTLGCTCIEAIKELKSGKCTNEPWDSINVEQFNRKLYKDDYSKIKWVKLNGQ